MHTKVNIGRVAPCRMPDIDEAAANPVPERSMVDPHDAQLIWKVYPESVSLWKKIVGATSLLMEMFPEPTSTGLRTLTLEDRSNGFLLATTHPNPKRRTAAHRAWAGARHSRAPGDTVQIMHEMGERGVDPDQRLEDTFKGYGHQSPANLAKLDVHFNHVPMSVPMFAFNFLQVDPGQEKSTRFQSKFGKNPLMPLNLYFTASYRRAEDEPFLEDRYQELGRIAENAFIMSQAQVRDDFVACFKPTTDKERASLESRVLDTIRGHLLLGQRTGFMVHSDARELAKLIGVLRSAAAPLYQRLGADLETLLSPDPVVERTLRVKAEAPSLVRHTEPNTLMAQNLTKLRQLLETQASDSPLRQVDKLPHPISVPGYHNQKLFLVSPEMTAAERMAAQYLLSLYPQADAQETFDWIHALPASAKRTIGAAIYQGHDRNHELPVQTRTTGMSVVFRGSLGELRDFNRHRALGRFIGMPNPLDGLPLTWRQAQELVSKGFTLPLYLTQIAQMGESRKVVERGFNVYYQELQFFLQQTHRVLGDEGDYSFALNLLPLGHQVDFITHWDPKQASYFPDLRVRDGGHINYRALAYDAARLFADSDPILSSIMPGTRPDPADRTQFFSRS